MARTVSVVWMPWSVLVLPMVHVSVEVTASTLAGATIIVEPVPGDIKEMELPVQILMR